MTYRREALERFKAFGMFCDDYNKACDHNCDKCGAMESAIVEALEKQIPKKPIDCDYVLPVYDRNGCQVDAMFMYKAKCPSCGEIIADGELEKSDMVEEKYCRNCGQRIDWSE